MIGKEICFRGKKMYYISCRSLIIAILCGTSLVRGEPLDYVHAFAELTIRNNNLIELKKLR